VPDVIGYSVGTRPDCITPEILDLFAEYQKKGKEVFVEYGLESGTDKILDLTNRLHSVAEFITAVRWAKDRGLRVIVHLILGLPQETEVEMLATADLLAALDIDGIKLHPLHVVRHTILEAWHKRGQIMLMNQQDYVRLACDTLERLPPKALVMRLHATSPAEILVDPPWCGRKWDTLRMIEDEMRRRKTRQGAKFAAARLRGLIRLAELEATPQDKFALPMAAVAG
jgi:radical SAM protein (TIGR01212 family)